MLDRRSIYLYVLQVAATCKTSALKDAGHDYRPTKDNYYDSIQEQIDTEAEVIYVPEVLSDFNSMLTLLKGIRLLGHVVYLFYQ